MYAKAMKVNKALENELYISDDLENGIRYAHSKQIHFNTIIRIKEVIKLMDLGLISFDIPIRSVEIWDNCAKSDYVSAILRDFPINDFKFFYKNNKYEVLDGKQRLDTLYEFCNDDFKLIGDCEFTNNKVFNFKFSEIPKEFQDKILKTKLMFIGVYPEVEKIILL